MLGKGDGLGPLEMGIAGHHRLLVLLGLVDDGLLQVQDLSLDGRDLMAQVEPQIHRHLVIPAAGGMEPLAGIADLSGEKALHIHVDILVVLRQLRLTGFDVLEHLLESRRNGRRILPGDDALLGQHGGVGQGAHNVLLVHPAVKLDGGIEIVY